MGKPLTMELIRNKAKTDNISQIKNLNCWGNDIDDVKILQKMPNLEILSLSVNLISTLKEFATLPKL